MLYVCPQCQDLLRDYLAGLGFDVDGYAARRPAHLMFDLAKAPFPTRHTFDAVLTALAIVLDRRLREGGLDYLISEECVTGWACDHGRPLRSSWSTALDLSTVSAQVASLFERVAG